MEPTRRNSNSHSQEFGAGLNPEDLEASEEGNTDLINTLRAEVEAVRIQWDVQPPAPVQQRQVRVGFKKSLSNLFKKIFKR